MLWQRAVTHPAAQLPSYSFKPFFCALARVSYAICVLFCSCSWHFTRSITHAEK